MTLIFILFYFNSISNIEKISISKYTQIREMLLQLTITEVDLINSIYAVSDVITLGFHQ